MCGGVGSTTRKPPPSGSWDAVTKFACKAEANNGPATTRAGYLAARESFPDSGPPLTIQSGVERTRRLQATPLPSRCCLVHDLGRTWSKYSICPHHAHLAHCAHLNTASVPSRGLQANHTQSRQCTKCTESVAAPETTPVNFTEEKKNEKEQEVEESWCPRAQYVSRAQANSYSLRQETAVHIGNEKKSAGDAAGKPKNLGPCSSVAARSGRYAHTSQAATTACGDNEQTKGLSCGVVCMASRRWLADLVLLGHTSGCSVDGTSKTNASPHRQGTPHETFQAGM